MKLSFLILPLVMLTSAIPAKADEKIKSPSATAKAPFPNYWDANAWENNSGKTFWRDRKSPRAVSNESAKSKTKQSTSTKGFFDRHTEK